MKKLFGTLAVAVLCFAAIPVEAMDWYLRGGAGLDGSLAADFSDADSAATHPPALFGVGPGNDGRQIGAYGDFGRFLLMEAAVGKRILPWLRSEIAVAYRPNMKYSGYANFRGVPGGQPVSASADSISGMAHCYIDIATLFGVPMGRFQPYLGGGLGVSYNRLDEMSYGFPGNPGAHKITVTPSGDHAGFACMATVGTGIALTDRIVVDIAYRYTDLGQVRTDAGRAFLNNRPDGIEIGETWAPLRTHGIFAGIRYLFGSN